VKGANVAERRENSLEETGRLRKRDDRVVSGESHGKFSS
jgi:hypothetical protein